MKTFEVGTIFFSEREAVYGVVVNDTQSVTTKKDNRVLEQVLTVNNTDTPDDAVLMEYQNLPDDPCRGIVVSLGIHYGFLDTQDLV